MKVMVGVVIAILLVASFALFWPETDDNAMEKTSVNAAPETVMQKDIHVEEDKSSHMQTVYDELVSGRKELKRQLAKTKHLLWGLTFPPEQAKEINNIMLNAHKFEKTPRMLGAFHDVKEIKLEIEKVKYSIQSLQELEALVEKDN